MKEYSIEEMIGNKFVENCKLDTLAINNSRSFLMGCAIAFIFLYHAYCIMLGYLCVFRFFTYLFVGVDIFMLISALGCSYSHENNGTMQFYLNRIKKVVPLYFLFAIVQTLVLMFFMGEEFTAFDWFCNLTTLSYWGFGGKLIDWYIASSLVLWILTPLLKTVVRKFGGWAIVAAVCISAVVMKVLISDEWYYACLLARVPIYMAGIYIYIYGSLQPLYGLILLPLLVLTGCNGYLIISMFAPSIMRFLIYVKEKFYIEKVAKVISLLGRFTLEIYFSNCIALALFKYYCDQHVLSKLNSLLGYFILNGLLAIFFIIANKRIRATLERKFN